MNNQLETLVNAVVAHIWAQTHPGEPLLESPKKGYYWGSNGKYEAAYHQLFQELVPSYGEAETLHGKALRRVSKVYYRVYNDGDGIYPDFFHHMEAYMAGKLTEFPREYYFYYPGDLCNHCGEVGDDCECDHCFCCGEHERDCACKGDEDE